MTADVAIIIVTYNSAGQIRGCLESVLQEKKGMRQQVIVVDNDSRDSTAGIVADEYPEVELFLPGENLGFAKGVNYGANGSDAEFILLLNPDTVVLDGAVDTIVRFARMNPGYGLYGGRTLKPDGSLEPSSCWGAPTLWSMGLFALGITSLAPRNRWLDPESLGTWKRDSVREVGVITGCFLLAPTYVWKRLGGLDERYFMYGEDADMGMRAQAMGYRPVICPSAKIIHEVGKSSETTLHKTLLLYRGKASLVRTHWTGMSQTLGLFLLAAGTGIRALGGNVAFRMRKRDGAGKWQTLWRRRAEWLPGYMSQ